MWSVSPKDPARPSQPGPCDDYDDVQGLSREGGAGEGKPRKRSNSLPVPKIEVCLHIGHHGHHDHHDLYGYSHRS